MVNLPPLRPPPRPHSPSGHRSQSSISQSSLRSESSLSTASNDSSQITAPSLGRRSPYFQQARPSTANGPAPSQSTSNLSTVQRQQPVRTSVDAIRTSSPSMANQPFTHRARQHSQGLFEPTLPSLPHSSSQSGGLTASQIAAQAAMHPVSPPLTSLKDERKRSYPGLSINVPHPQQPNYRRHPSDAQSPPAGLQYSNGTLGGNRLAATTAANAAFPNGRSPLPSPGVPAPSGPFEPPPEKEPKTKSSKMKLFSKPKNIGLSKEKEAKVPPGAPSPGKGAISSNLLRGGFANASTTSLSVDPASSNASIYSTANASTSTLVPVTTTEKEKEKRHHFLSRQKHKLKDEPPQLSLSSAHSNSQPTNPEKPQPLYSFTPDSPGASTFSKSVSGLDLRHGGRALRERKKEEKAALAAKMDIPPVPPTINTAGPSDQFGPSSSYDAGTTTPSASNANTFPFPSEQAPAISAQQLSNLGASMGLSGIGPDDAWPLLKARLLNLFSGEELRTPIEDFNALVGVHIRRCVQRKNPNAVLEDLRELLQTGFSSLSQTLRGVPEDRLVTKLVEMWLGVHGSILPFLQAVFLPMDLEFKGRGHILSVREAQEFWGAMPESLKSDERPASAGGTTRLPTLGEELDVRRITLITFRDIVLLPRSEILMAIFSRLSLDSINASTSPDPPRRAHARSDPVTTGAEQAYGVTHARPDTAGSLSPNTASFNSQSSTLLDANSPPQTHPPQHPAPPASTRSRTTSSTSAGSFTTTLPHLATTPPATSPPPFPPSATTITLHNNQHPPTRNPTPSSPRPPVPLADPTTITQTVARMLQCLYVLASCQTGDVGQGVVEGLTGALKYNWLGRGRMGGDRRGWVGVRARGGRGAGIGVGA